jgi:hypothetical protein
MQNPVLADTHGALYTPINSNDETEDLEYRVPADHLFVIFYGIMNSLAQMGPGCMTIVASAEVNTYAVVNI